ncbi:MULTISPECIES: acetoacetate decarboxylase (ADC) [unclassified Pseudomonas]|uniref:acetoacetate decarboxylase (ADC) n=1 Tax=unclassified Pseudomonas TaxID=196821 RepID=UPI00244780A7|nr:MULTISPECIES: acetoacetate decarboxylase (ADC) [unclassified Pseudomonas]MDH0301720.1 acetoacetate decarboxylase (ADC) [Pseudomonas sp. GD04091]MDH1984939.1 acetoacetate decarboxylase (ADC) [Pseudomonas sp. GD03689]
MAGALLTPLAPTALADANGLPDHADTTVIDIAGHPVPVLKGGLYDRYRSNPPLAVIQAQAPDLDLSWFKGLEKTKVDMGFESYSPNFYYRNSRVTAVYTADIDRLRALMPAQVLEQVQPLQIWPGRGLVAFTAYTYDYCDNDSYNEIALSIITNKPGSSNLGPVTLIGQSMSKDFWGYVLKLPVNTELARVRGVVGYNLPKWLTPIERREDASAVTYDIADAQSGQVDVSFRSKKLAQLSHEAGLVTNSFTNLDHQGHLAYGYAVSRQTSHASSMNGDSVQLVLGNGSLSSYIRSLQLGRLVKYEYVPQFQSALYAPKPLAALTP